MDFNRGGIRGGSNRSGPLGLGAGPGPRLATLEPIPDGSRHQGQTQRKIEVQRTDPENDRGTYNIINIQKIDDAHFDYAWKFGTDRPRPVTCKSGYKNLQV
jgi:hypothetical protein